MKTNGENLQKELSKWLITMKNNMKDVKSIRKEAEVIEDEE